MSKPWPALAALILAGGLSLSMAQTPLVDQENYVWPNTAPIDKSDPYWEFNNNLSLNGVRYKKEEVSPGRWEWVVDKNAMRALADREAHRQALWRALRTRVLSEAEMEEVARWGDLLNIEPMVQFRHEEKLRELNDALYQQQRLRSLAK